MTVRGHDGSGGGGMGTAYHCAIEKKGKTFEIIRGAYIDNSVAHADDQQM